MHKVLIIGSAGSGKTVLATRLGALIGLPVIHLDALYWKPGWIEMPKDVWTQIVAEAVQRESWIMDGNYGGTLDERLRACDTVIFLAFPRLLCLYRVFKRAVTYWGKTRPDLNSGCPEKLPDREFLYWIWSYPKQRMPKIIDALQAYEGQKEVITLKSPFAVRKFLTAVEQKMV